MMELPRPLAAARPSSLLLRALGLAALLLAAEQRAAWAAVDCPVAVKGHRLSSFSLFEGDPAQQADLAPDDSRAGPRGSYVNTWSFQSSAGLVAVCRFDGGTAQQIPLPGGLTQCRASGSAREVQAGCR